MYNKYINLIYNTTNSVIELVDYRSFSLDFTVYQKYIYINIE